LASLNFLSKFRHSLNGTWCSSS